MGKRVGSMRRRGRRTILWGVAIFIVVQLTASVLIDRYGLRIRFPQAAAVLGELEARGGSPDIIAFGSSRTIRGLAASTAEKKLREVTGDVGVTVFKAAVPAGDLTVTDFMLDQMLKIGVQPRVAVIEISPEFLNANNEWMNEHLRRQIIWTNTPQCWGQILKENRLIAYVKNRTLPLFLHRHQLIKEGARLWDEGWSGWSADYRLSGFLAATPEPEPAANSPRPNLSLLKLGNPGDLCHKYTNPPATPAPGDSPGLVGSLPKPAGDETANKDFYKFENWLKQYQIGGVAVAALEKVLNRCHRHGIFPVLVVPPLSTAHRALYTAEINASFLAHLEQVKQKYPFVLVDYRACLADERFIDHHHLGDAGSTQFSALLAEDLLAPVWQKIHGEGTIADPR